MSAMAWVRIDDRLYDHPKIKLACKTEPVSLAIWLLSLSSSAAYLTDGHVDESIIKRLFPNTRQRRRGIDALVQAGLWEPNGDGWEIHDYLDYNDPREVVIGRRRAREARRRRNREALDDSRR